MYPTIDISMIIIAVIIVVVIVIMKQRDFLRRCIYEPIPRIRNFGTPK